MKNVISKTHKYLNIGGGKFCQRDNGWLNLEYIFPAYEKKRDPSAVDISFNLMDDGQIPLPNESLTAIYCEHTLEHLPENVTIKRLKDIYRLLTNGGVFRCSLPDIDIFWKRYFDGTSDAEYGMMWTSKEIKSKEEIFVDVLCSEAAQKISRTMISYILNMNKFHFNRAINSICSFSPTCTKDIQAQYPGSHWSWWTYNKLKEKLLEIGFRVSNPLQKNETDFPEIFMKKYIDKTKPEISFRLEAIK